MKMNIEKMAEQEELQMACAAKDKKASKPARKTTKMCKVVYENKHTRIVGFISEEGVGYQLPMPDSYKLGSKMVRVQFGDTVKIV